MNEHQWEQSEAIILLCDVLHDILDDLYPTTELHAKVSDISLMIQGGRIREREENPHKEGE